MRRRSVLLLVSGVLAVGGILLPSIQEQQSTGDTRITGVVVNGGHPVVLGPSDSAAFSFSVTAEDNSGISSVDSVGLWGSNYAVRPASPTQCTAKSATVSVCTGTASVDVAKKQIFDNMAGVWYLQATAHGRDGDRRQEEKAGTFSVLKAGQLANFGSPQTATKGELITINGALQQPDWRSQTWVPNPGQKVTLEFCAKGCRTPKAVAQVSSDGQGQLTAEVRATGTGTYSWVYPGTYWAAPVQSSPAQVTVS